MNKALALKLEDARSQVARVYRDNDSEPEEILGALEKLLEDIEMFSNQIAARMEEENGEAEAGNLVPDQVSGRDLPGGGEGGEPGESEAVVEDRPSESPPPRRKRKVRGAKAGGKADGD